MCLRLLIVIFNYNFTAPYNNMRTVEFKNTFYTAVNHVADLSGNKCDISESSKGHVSKLRLADLDLFFSALNGRYDND